jgi:hypothetical protein
MSNIKSGPSELTYSFTLTYELLSCPAGRFLPSAKVSFTARRRMTRVSRECRRHTLQEGLAQFYTRTPCTRLELEAPGTLKASILLLESQSPGYHSHASCIKEHKPDEVCHGNATWLMVPRDSPTTLEEFNERLEDAKKRLCDPK